MATNLPFNWEDEWNWDEQKRVEIEEAQAKEFELFSQEEKFNKNNNIKEFFNIVNNSFNVGDMERICNIIDGKDVDV